MRTGSLAALLLVALAAAPATTRAASADDLADLEAKADYAFLTEDRATLARLLAESATLAASAVPLEGYQYAHVALRALQLAVRRHDEPAARRAGDACLDSLAPLDDADPRFAEGLALESACAAYVASLGGLRGLAAARRSDARLAAAEAADAGNPRVLLVGALSGWFRGGATAEQRAAAARDFRRAAEAFDTVTAPVPGGPTWGGAEAWLFVGRAAEEAADLVGARSAYERALVVAPDFAAARRRLHSLAGRR